MKICETNLVCFCELNWLAIQYPFLQHRIVLGDRPKKPPASIFLSLQHMFKQEALIIYLSLLANHIAGQKVNGKTVLSEETDISNPKNIGVSFVKKGGSQFSLILIL